MYFAIVEVIQIYKLLDIVMPTMRVTLTVDDLQQRYFFILNGGAISWNNKKQPTAMHCPTTEAEYMAATPAAKKRPFGFKGFSMKLNFC